MSGQLPGDKIERLANAAAHGCQANLYLEQASDLLKLEVVLGENCSMTTTDAMPSGHKNSQCAHTVCLRTMRYPLLAAILVVGVYATVTPLHRSLANQATPETDATELVQVELPATTVEPTPTSPQATDRVETPGQLARVVESTRQDSSAAAPTISENRGPALARLGAGSTVVGKALWHSASTVQSRLQAATAQFPKLAASTQPSAEQPVEISEPSPYDTPVELPVVSLGSLAREDRTDRQSATQAQPMKPALPTEPAIVLTNPASNQLVVHYALNGQVFQLQPGEEQKLSAAETAVVQFNRGPGLGIVHLELQRGRHAFQVSKAGWSLTEATP